MVQGLLDQAGAKKGEGAGRGKGKLNDFSHKKGGSLQRKGNERRARARRERKGGQKTPKVKVL